MNLVACKRLALRSLDGTWYRAISAKHWKMALKTEQTAQIPGRFNPGMAAKTPYEILYLAENQLVALYEVQAIFGPPAQPIANPHRSKVVPIDVDVRLASVADLTALDQQVLLETSAQELTVSWDTYPPGGAPTQRRGAALFRTKDIEGFLAISARVPRCRTLIVFPQKLLPGSELVFRDVITRRVHRIRAH
jgi:RES domain-containing protein